MQLTPINSSNIHSVGYDLDTRTMRVRFRDRTDRHGAVKPGGIYEHQDVPQEAFDAFMAAESKGAHYAQHIRRTGERGFEHRKVEDAL